jgi:molecular chaperone DnaK
VLLVGGSSRIPMVGHLVSAELGCPTSVDTHPKHAVALGAAAVGAEKAGPGGASGPAAGAAAVMATELDHPIPPTADMTSPVAGETPPTADMAALAGGFAAVPLIGAGAPPPELRDQGDARFGKRRSRRGHGASNLAPDADSHHGQDPPGPDPRHPSGDPLPGHPRRRRAPVMAGVLVLVAALAGGGTVAFRALSNSTPSNTQPLHPVSHTSSSTPSSSSSSRGTTGSGHHASARTGGTSGRSTTTPVTPTVVPATTPVTPRTNRPHTTPPTWTPPTKTSPTWHPTTTTTTPTWTPTTTPPTTTPPTTAPPSTSASTPSTQGGNGGTGGTP